VREAGTSLCALQKMRNLLLFDRDQLFNDTYAVCQVAILQKKQVCTSMQFVSRKNALRLFTNSAACNVALATVIFHDLQTPTAKA
jgi:hypothetical protein